MSGGNSHQRAIANAAKKRTTKQVSETVAVLLKNNKDTPWYDRNLFWGFAALAATLVLTVVAAMLKDLRWLLFFAWPSAGVAWWVACRALRGQLWRWVLFSVLLIATGGGLLRLNTLLGPKPASTILTPPLTTSLEPPKQDTPKQPPAARKEKEQPPKSTFLGVHKPTETVTVPPN